MRPSIGAHQRLYTEHTRRGQCVSIIKTAIFKIPNAATMTSDRYVRDLSPYWKFCDTDLTLHSLITAQTSTVHETKQYHHQHLIPHYLSVANFQDLVYKKGYCTSHERVVDQESSR
jgi:hypothetical protein